MSLPKYQYQKLININMTVWQKPDMKSMVTRNISLSGVTPRNTTLYLTTNLK